MSRGYGWGPYVSVAERRAKARAKMNKLRKKGIDVKPIEIEGRKITHTFWGQAWCDHLEQFSDYSNRLPRGRSYVRNGSVCHLEINPGKVKAMVSGSRLYNVEVTIKKLPSNIIRPSGVTIVPSSRSSCSLVWVPNDISTWILTVTV